MYEREKEELVLGLKKKGIKDNKVLKAIYKVERHLFVNEAMRHLAYADKPLPIGSGQTISQPYTVAFMTQMLNIEKDDKVLEIGTGSGYQSAILNYLGCQVYSIERDYDLYQAVLKLFDELRIRVHCKCGDGTIGWEEYAPYKGIIVTAGSPSVPVQLKKQLAIGGKLVIPVGDREVQRLLIITKKDETTFDEEDVPYFRFVPLIGKNGW